MFARVLRDTSLRSRAGSSPLSCTSQYVPPRPVPRRAMSALTNLFDGGDASTLHIKSVSGRGIELGNGWLFKSPCILVNGEPFLWKIPGSPWTGWSTAPFEVFEVVKPTPGAYSRRTRVVLRGTKQNACRVAVDWDWKELDTATAVNTRVSQESWHRNRRHGYGALRRSSPWAISFNIGFSQSNACSTYNVLLEEGRRVAAALIPL